jgi:hypothetical protein
MSSRQRGGTTYGMQSECIRCKHSQHMPKHGGPADGLTYAIGQAGKGKGCCWIPCNVTFCPNLTIVMHKRWAGGSHVSNVGVELNLLLKSKFASCGWRCPPTQSHCDGASRALECIRLPICCWSSLLGQPPEYKAVDQL